MSDISATPSAPARTESTAARSLSLTAAARLDAAQRLALIQGHLYALSNLGFPTAATNIGGRLVIAVSAPVEVAGDGAWLWDGVDITTEGSDDA